MKTQKFSLRFYDKVKSGLKFRPLALKICRKVVKLEEYPDCAEASLTLVDAQEIRRLNKEYRGIDNATDVLSFPMGEFNPDEGTMMLGDIIISVPTAIKQAEEYGHSVEREMAFLTVHGMLHLLGYDHENTVEQEVMFQKQEDILQELGITR